MSENPPRTSDVPPPPRRFAKLLAALAGLLLLLACFAYLQVSRADAVVARFQSALETGSAERLGSLARRQDRDQLLAHARQIWELREGKHRDVKTGLITSAAADLAAPCLIKPLPTSWLDLLRGHRDLVAIALDPATGRPLHALYFRVRAGSLLAGADPHKFQWVEQQSLQILAALQPPLRQL